MADQTMDEDSQSAAPADESASKVEGSEKDSTQVFVYNSFARLRYRT